MRKMLFITVLATLLVFMTAGVAMAAHSPVGDRTGWAEMSAKGCSACHDTAPKHTSGPHGGYTTTTNRCQACHKVHKAGNTSLLPGATVTAACNFCHDLTATDAAPYYASDLASTADIKSSHRVFGTVGATVYNTAGNFGLIAIPGGNDADGGTANLNVADQGKLSGTSGVDGEFTCNSCHTPHALSAGVVDEYLGDSHVKFTSKNMTAGTGKLFITNRILKNRVNGVDVVSNKYGSEWCIGCHQGRDNEAMGGVFNHPVDEAAIGYDYVGTGMNDFATLLDATVRTDAYGAKYYLINTTGGAVADENFTYDPRSNKWYAMEAVDALTGTPRPDGNVAYAVGDGPSCQQCHGNPRNVELGWFDGTWASGAGVEDGGEPSRYTFPHMSTNKALLTEAGDDFCTNCHGINNLP